MTVIDLVYAEGRAERLLAEAEQTTQRFRDEPAAINEDLRMLAELQTAQAQAWATLAVAVAIGEGR